MIVEAKRLNRRLDDAHDQIAEYCYAQNIKNAIITDGNDWVLLEIEPGLLAVGDDDEDYYDDDEEFEVEIPILETARFSVSRGDAV